MKPRALVPDRIAGFLDDPGRGLLPLDAGHRLFDGGPGFFQQPVHLLPAGSDRVALFLSVGGDLVFVVPFQGVQFVAELFGLFLRGDEQFVLPVHLHDDFVQPPFGGTHEPGGPLEHFPGHAEPAPDLQGVACARDPLSELVGGREGFHVEDHRTVFDPLGSRGEGLERVEMGRGRGDGSPPGKRLEDGHAQGRPRRRVRAGAQFVEEYQGAGIGPFQYGPDMSEVGREGAQARLDRLLVPDVREDGIEHGDFGVVVRRDVQTGLCHHGHDANRFQGDRLAAHVGTGDHEGFRVFADFKVQRNDGFALA